MRNRLWKSCMVFAVLGSIAVSVGCYETMFRLSPIAEAKVERDLCGNWTLRSAQGSDVFLGVRNLDDHLYSVSWRSADEDHPLQLVADSTQIAGIRFIHARALPEDGALSDTHLILRADLDGDHLTLRNLNDEFLQARNVISDDALRATIEANLENNDLYDDNGFSGERSKDEK